MGSEKEERHGRFPPRGRPDDDELLSEKQKGDDRVPPQLMSNNEKIPSEKEYDHRIQPLLMPDEERIPSEEGKSDDHFRPQGTPDDDVIPCEAEKLFSILHQITKYRTVRSACLRKLIRCSYSTRATRRTQLRSASWLRNSTPLIVSSTQVQARTLIEKTSSRRNGSKPYKRVKHRH